MCFHLHSCTKIIFIYLVTYNFSLETDLMLDYQEVSFSGLQNNPLSGKKSVMFLPADMVSSFKVSQNYFIVDEANPPKASLF